jgi:hypothetical protein
MIKHLEENNMTYFQHLWFALTIAGTLVIHAVLPWFFQTYASDHLCSRNQPKE